MKLSENLKHLRKQYGIEQGVLAEAINVSIKTISHWETGYTEPSVMKLIQIAYFFDVSIDGLVGRETT